MEHLENDVERGYPYQCTEPSSTEDALKLVSQDKCNDSDSSISQQTDDTREDGARDVQGGGRYQQRYHGVTICFRGVTVEVGKGRRVQTILSDVSGVVKAGTLSALMGPSGSGKTTLVDVITKRKNTGRRQGVVMYDGEKPRASFLRYKLAYVQQDDCLISNMTVEETLLYNFDLTVGRFMDKEQRWRVVNTILADLSLEGCRSLLIGSPFQRGISGGQRKRVAIGISLLGSPSVLFMDEPTSGLDSFTAFETISLVKSFVSRGLTVVSTIHAPNSSIFALFDSLMILLDGKVVYSGKAHAGVDFFKGCGFDGPGDASPADWLTSIVVQASRLHRSEELASYYSKSSLYTDTMMALEDAMGSRPVTRKSSGMRLRQQHKFAWILERSGVYAFLCISKHRIKADFRMPNFVIPRVCEKVLFAIIILTLYWGVGKQLDDSASLQETLARPMQINTALYMWGILPVFGSVSVIPSIVNERHVFDRERKSGYYGCGAYLFSKIFEESILACFSSAVVAVAVWFALSLSGSWLLFWLVYFVTTIVGIVLAYSCAAVAPNTEYAIIMCSGMNIILLFFVGLLIRWQDIPSYWKWVVYINHLHYAWSALVTNEFTPEDTVTSLNIPILEYLNLDNSLSCWDYLGYEVIFIVVYFIFGLFALRFINYGRR